MAEQPAHLLKLKHPDDTRDNIITPGIIRRMHTSGYCTGYDSGMTPVVMITGEGGGSLRCGRLFTVIHDMFTPRVCLECNSPDSRHHDVGDDHAPSAAGTLLLTNERTTVISSQY